MQQTKAKSQGLAYLLQADRGIKGTETSTNTDDTGLVSHISIPGLHLKIQILRILSEIKLSVTIIKYQLHSRFFQIRLDQTILIWQILMNVIRKGLQFLFQYQIQNGRGQYLIVSNTGSQKGSPGKMKTFSDSLRRSTRLQGSSNQS